MSSGAAGPMAEIEGVVTIVQEGRFQLTDMGGVAHNFLLSRFALAETDQLPALQNRQARVRVKYSKAGNLIAYIAHRIDLLDVA
ncbi:MAG: hypothetical protein WA840_08075 [Caulobacteraceae bacterium]